MSYVKVRKPVGTSVHMESTARLDGDTLVLECTGMDYVQRVAPGAWLEATTYTDGGVFVGTVTSAALAEQWRAVARG